MNEYIDPTFFKNQLAIEIYQIFIKMEISQDVFAKKLGIRQPKISRIFNGHLKEFSLETLIQYLHILGRYVEIKIINYMDT